MPKRIRRVKTSALQKLQDDSGYSKKSAEVLDWTYYDTMVLAAATTYRLFVNPLGSGGKTLSDTNMINAGLLPQGQNMKVHAIKTFIMTPSAFSEAQFLAVLKDLLWRGTLEFVVPGKDSLLTVTLMELMGVPWGQVLVPSAPGDNINVASRGRFTGVFPLNVPIKIGAVQSFECRVTFHGGFTPDGLDTEIRIGLNGRLIRMS